MIPAAIYEPNVADAVGKSLPKVPELRSKTNMAEWAREVMLKLCEAKLGQYANMHRRELDDVDERDRNGLAQLYAVLLSKHGPLSVEPELRAILLEHLETTEVCYMHGARVLQIFLKGIRVVPEPDELQDGLQMRFNKLRMLKLHKDSTKSEVRKLLKSVLDASNDLDEDPWEGGDFERHLRLVTPPGDGRRGRVSWQKYLNKAKRARPDLEFTDGMLMLTYIDWWSSALHSDAMYGGMTTYGGDSSGEQTRRGDMSEVQAALQGGQKVCFCITLG